MSPANNDRSERSPRIAAAKLGPGLLITAAFIGPGTVVTASKAGADFGCELLWAILFACAGTMVLQSFAARVGILTGVGLGETIRGSLAQSPWLRPLSALVIVAIGAGNAAYQTGNLTGAAVGVSAVTGGSINLWVLGLAGIAAVLVALGRYRILHRVLVGLVVLLSVSFVYSACSALPSVQRIANGLLVPSVSSQSLSVVIGLIGTTIVPYNLFLHASGAAATWASVPPVRALHLARWDTVLSISLGGFVTAAILLTASSAFFDHQTSWTSTAQIADQLRPTLGAASGVAFAAGLFAAGLTSSVTAPVATAYAVCGCLGWDARPSGVRFRIIALTVITIGAAFAIGLGSSPAATILMAQVANGLLLPVMGALLLLLLQRPRPALESAGVPPLSAWNLAAGWFVVGTIGLLGMWRIVTALFV